MPTHDVGTTSRPGAWLPGGLDGQRQGQACWSGVTCPPGRTRSSSAVSTCSSGWEAQPQPGPGASVVVPRGWGPCGQTPPAPTPPTAPTLPREDVAVLCAIPFQLKRHIRISGKAAPLLAPSLGLEPRAPRAVACGGRRVSHLQAGHPPRVPQSSHAQELSGWQTGL